MPDIAVIRVYKILEHPTCGQSKLKLMAYNMYAIIIMLFRIRIDICFPVCYGDHWKPQPR